MDPLKEMSIKMNEIIAFIKDEFSKIRTNRPTTRLVEHIKVSYMNTEIQLIHIATLSISPPRDIIVSPWDKSTIPAITKAIEEADIGLGILADSSGVRLTIPELTGERKQDLIRLIKTIAEENRIKMRAERNKIVKELESLPEDQKFKGKNNLQKLVDDFNEQVDNLVKDKITEIES